MDYTAQSPFQKFCKRIGLGPEVDSSSSVEDQLKFFILKTIELIPQKLSYLDTVRHIGNFLPHHRQFLKEGGTAASIHPDSSIISEFVFTLGPWDGEYKNKIITAEFYFNPKTVTFADLEKVFGDWYRSPPEPDECSFAYSCYKKYDITTGAPWSLYGEFQDYSKKIEPTDYATRLFFQRYDGRWGGHDIPPILPPPQGQY